MLFVVVNGVPSVAVQVMVGSGQLGAQTVLPVADLPIPSMASKVNNTTSSDRAPTKSGASARASLPLAAGLLPLLPLFLLLR